MTKKVTLAKEVRIPDPLTLARVRQAPALGPAILFFSGGTALREASRKLIEYTHNSVHILTPFDSGGSSAELRRAFNMPAVGDIRNRLLALADQSLTGNPALARLFAYRLPKQATGAELARELESLVEGSHQLMQGLVESLRSIVRHHLEVFERARSADFDLRGASLGNLVLTGGYLELGHRLEPIIHMYSKLAGVRGTVRPVLDASLQLTARLENGSTVLGQHLLTGKETPPIQSKVREISLCRDDAPDCPAPEQVSSDLQALITGADLICFPMGSFYSSLLATLLPAGVGRAVARAGCPKVYLPSTGHDPEAIGLSLPEQVERLLGLLLADCPEGSQAGDVLDVIALDRDLSRYAGQGLEELCAARGLRTLRLDLVTSKSAPLVDPDRLVEALISLAG